MLVRLICELNYYLLAYLLTYCHQSVHQILVFIVILCYTYM